jgi:putative transposase
MPPPHPNAPPRKRIHHRPSPTDYRYLTFSCYQRQPFLTKPRTCCWLAQALTTAQESRPLRLIAYVFMSEHVHLLLQPLRTDPDIPAFLLAIKSSVAKKARAHILKNAPDFLPRMQSPTDHAFHFWQPGPGYDRNIFTPQELHEKIRYIHQNPVRRQLVSRATDYPWSSAADHAHLRQGPLPVHTHDLPWC